MSDIQELIHKTSMDCIEKGKRIERERIIKLLDQKHNPTWSDQVHNQSGLCDACELIALIKGEK